MKSTLSAPTKRAGLKTAASISTFSPESNVGAAKVGPEFFARDALTVARALVGMVLVHTRPDGLVQRARIVETEAYRGPEDKACHARAGLTARTRTLFGPPGHAYVFFVYGMHECFNVVCAEDGRGHAVLIRAAEPLSGFDREARTDGPGRLTRAMGISRLHDGHDLRKEPLFLEARASVPTIARSPRVGVAYAGAWAARPWRFFDANSGWVSKPPRQAIGLGEPLKAGRHSRR